MAGAVSTRQLVNGYRPGGKVHAVDLADARNSGAGWDKERDEGMSLCGWNTLLSSLPFSDNVLACRTCARASKR
jgi:hypothetical protein